MTVVSVPRDVWTLVTTASADTIVENLGHPEVFISRTLPTFGSFEKEKLKITTVVEDDPVYIYSVGKDTKINYFASSAGPEGPRGNTGDAGPIGPPSGQVPVVVASGEFIGNGLDATALGAQAQVANRTVIGLFIPSVSLTIDQLGVSISTFVASATLKLVVYATDANGRPTNILRETATIDAGSNGTKFTNITPLALTAGTKYWVGLRSSTNAAVRTLGVGSVPAITYTNSATPVMESSLILTETYGNAAANWTYAASQHSSALVPLILMRVA